MSLFAVGGISNYPLSIESQEQVLRKVQFHQPPSVGTTCYLLCSTQFKRFLFLLSPRGQGDKSWFSSLPDSLGKAVQTLHPRGYGKSFKPLSSLLMLPFSEPEVFQTLGDITPVFTVTSMVHRDHVEECRTTVKARVMVLALCL